MNHLLGVMPLAFYQPLFPRLIFVGEDKSDGFPAGLRAGSIRMGATAKEKECKTALCWHLPVNILK